MATKRYLTNSAAPISASTLAGWSDTASVATCALDATKSGTNTANTKSETSTSGTWTVLQGQWTSDSFLQAGTFGGTFSLIIAVRESAAAANFYDRVRILICAADGSNNRLAYDSGAGAVGTERGTATDGTSRTISGTISDISVAAGDRIRLEVGFNATNTSSTSYSGGIRYGGTDATDLTSGTTTGVTTRSPHITFNDARVDTLFTAASGGGGGTGQAALFTGDDTGLACLTAPSTTHTMTCWFYLVTEGNYSTWYEPSDGTTAHYVQCSGGSNDDNISAAITSNTSDPSSGVAITINGWYKFMLRHDFGTNVAEVHFQPPGSSTWQVYSGNCDSSPTWDRYSIGFSDAWPNEPFRGRIAALKIWNAILSDTERDAEFTQYRAVRGADLFSEHLMEGANLTDYSGNGRVLTNPGGTMPTSADGPPGVPLSATTGPVLTNLHFHVLA